LLALILAGIWSMSQLASAAGTALAQA